MKKFSALSIEEAIQKARLEFCCLESELEYEVVLHPKKGFWGFGKQEAIILAQKIEVEEKSNESSPSLGDESYLRDEAYSQIQENFFQEKVSEDRANSSSDLGKKIAQEAMQLFSFLPYNIEQIKVRIEKDSYAYIEFLGEDCGLLIGERGYRYQAIYYLLLIWIKKEYGLGVRLEIADFLKNKEKKVEEYLEEHYNQIITRTFFQTRSFDPLSAGIALKRFREAIPDKYIVIKQISELESVILINEFKNK